MVEIPTTLNNVVSSEIVVICKKVFRQRWFNSVMLIFIRFWRTEAVVLLYIYNCHFELILDFLMIVNLFKTNYKSSFFNKLNSE